MALDHQNRKARLQLDLRVTPLTAPIATNIGEPCCLLNGFYYFVIEPPGAPDQGSDLSEISNDAASMENLLGLCGYQR